MKLELWCINKTSKKFIQEGIDIYTKRIGHYVKFEIKIFPAPRGSQKLPIQKLKIAEADIIISKLDTSDHLILLDEHGKQYSSIEFSKQIEKLQNASIKRLIFLVGGGYGFDEKLHAISKSKISLSKMTFPHELVRVIFLEQLYRACTILKGEKYHHI